MFIDGIPACADKGIRAVMSAGSVFGIVPDSLSQTVGCYHCIARGDAELDEQLNLEPRYFIPPP
jgi:hypothetical protein